LEMDAISDGFTFNPYPVRNNENRYN
jgi:hypothetical protein